MGQPNVSVSNRDSLIIKLIYLNTHLFGNLKFFENRPVHIFNDWQHFVT